MNVTWSRLALAGGLVGLAALIVSGQLNGSAFIISFLVCFIVARAWRDDAPRVWPASTEAAPLTDDGDPSAH